MKKIIFFTVIAFIFQVVNMNIFGQVEIKDEFQVGNSGHSNVGSLGHDAFYQDVILASGNSSTSVAFRVGNAKGLQMKLRTNNDFMLYFPLSSGESWNRIIAKDHLSFSAGDRGVNDNLSDLFIAKNGRVGIGTTSPTEKLAVAGSITASEAIMAGTIMTEGIQLNSGVITATGKIGVGTTNPTEKLTVNGNIKLTGDIIGNTTGFNIEGIRGLEMKKGMNNDFTLYFPVSDNSNSKWNRIIAKNHLSFTAGDRGVTQNETDLFISTNGNIGIGTPAPDQKLTVNGNISASNSKMYINVNANQVSTANKAKFSAFIAGGILSEDYAIGPKSTWADHVFSTDYKLQNLNEVENYIKTNNRLPDIPSAAEVEENGYTLHDMNVKLLQKVEELTLYSIEQNKEIEQLKKVANSYESLMEKVNQLESQINK
ncbi:autotransporter outer membrane beta-barrel domain-containing protein [Viscerimonas tarda]